MGLLGDRKPNVEALERDGDVDGLAEAALYQERKPGAAGGMRDFGVPIRAQAIAALGGLGPDQGQETVEVALRDPAERVRVAAVRVLHARRQVGPLVRALPWLPGGESQSRKFALKAVFDLRELTTPMAVAAALVGREDDAQLGDEEAPLIAWLIEAEDPKARQALIALLVERLDDDSATISDRAAELLVELAPHSISAVVDELKTGPAAAEAAWVLGQVGDPETLDVLTEGLRHKTIATRRECALALGELRDPLAVKPLLRATRDPEHSVRVEAGKALDLLGNAAVIVGVAALLRPALLESAPAPAPAPSSNGAKAGEKAGRSHPKRSGGSRQKRAPRAGGTRARQ